MQSSLEKLKQILLPSFMQVILCLTASIFLFLTIYRDILLTYLQRYLPLTSLPNSGNLPVWLRVAADSSIGHNAVIIIFWSIVGLVAYSLFWTLVNIGIEARNEVVIETTYVNKGNIGDRFLGLSNQIIVGLVLIAFLIVSAIFLIPLWTDMFGVLITAHFGLTSLAQGVGAVLGCALNIYTAYTLAQLFFISR